MSAPAFMEGMLLFRAIFGLSSELARSVVGGPSSRGGADILSRFPRRRRVDALVALSPTDTAVLKLAVLATVVGVSWL